MKTQTTELVIRPMMAQDLDLVGKWLLAPHVARWFPDADYIEDIEDHLEEAEVACWIVHENDRPVAYLQDYDVHAWPDHPLGFLPKGARGMDTFIGEVDVIGRGFGPVYLAQHARDLFLRGVPALGIDPDPENTAAFRAYGKAGFTGTDEVETPWGRVRLMTLIPTGVARVG